MKLKSLSFKNRRGHTLDARLDLPDTGEIRACALFAHCFTCNKDTRTIANISRALAEQGMAVLRFDFTGLGRSEGEFADTNFSSNVTDLIDAAAYMASEFSAPGILIGHSLGGAAALQAAGSIDSVKAVVTIAAPAEPSHVHTVIRISQKDMQEKGESDVMVSGRSFKIKQQFLDDIRDSNVREYISGLGRALLIFHSPLDNIVGIDNAARIFKAARHPKSFISLDTADHMLSDERDSRYVGRVIAAWAERYILNH